MSGVSISKIHQLPPICECGCMKQCMFISVGYIKERNKSGPCKLTPFVFLHFQIHAIQIKKLYIRNTSLTYSVAIINFVVC